MGRTWAQRPAPSGSTRPRRTTSVATALVAGLVLALGMLLCCLAWTGRPIALDGPAADRSPMPAAVEDTLDRPVRSLPLQSGPDVLATWFPEGLTSHREITRRLVGLARPLGLGEEILYLTSMDLELGESYEVVEVGDSWRPAYPYVYGDIDPMVDAELDRGAAAADPGTVLDLTALLVAAAAGPPPDDTEWGSFGAGAPVAYSILLHLPETATTCDLQLQLAFLVSLGSVFQDAALAHEVDRAREACPGDPTPLWLRSQARATLALDDRVSLAPQGFLAAAGRSDALEGAMSDLEQLRQEFPQSPLGWAGTADVLLDRADASEARRLRPFQVRAWRQEALQLYELARSKSGDPGLLAGHLRALTALGRLGEADALLQTVPDALRRTHAFVTLEVRLLQARRDFAGVVALLEETAVEFASGLDLVPGEADVRLPGYGRIDVAPEQVADAAMVEAGGSTADDVSFIPDHRVEWSSDGVCLEVDAMNALVLNGRLEEVAGWRSPVFTTPLERPWDGPCEEFGRPVRADGSFDHRQDLSRWAGDLDQAAAIVEEWSTAYPDDYGAQQRAGEVAYLDGDFTEAVRRFEDAASLWDAQRAREAVDDYSVENQASTISDVVQPSALIPLQLAAAQEAAGRSADAEATLTDLLDEIPDSETIGDPDAEEFYARSQLGLLLLGRGSDEQAADHLRPAVEIGQQHGWGSDHEGDPLDVVLLRGAQESNLALALARSGESAEALSAAEAALRRDSLNPIFLDTLAFAAQLAGEPDVAVDGYRRALGADPTSYVSANNLAVLLADRGDLNEASRLLRDALAVSPDYAEAWHNLGVVESQRGPRHFITSQRARGQAGRLDRSLRDAEPVLRMDDTIYESGLDISKPLSPTWRYETSAGLPQGGFTLTMALLLLVRIAWALGLDRLLEGTTSRLMSAPERARGRWALLWSRTPTFAAVGVTTLVLAVGGGWFPTWTERGLMVVLLAALVLLPLAVRAAVASTAPQHFGWLPAMTLGAAAAPFGVTLAPFPGLEEEHASEPRTAWSAAVTVVGVTGVFAAVALLSAVPVARHTAMAGFALVASIMLPIAPFDGARLRSRSVGLFCTGALGLATAAFAVHWI